MSKYFEIMDVNIADNYAIIWHNILERQFKVAYDVETITEKREYNEGGYVIDTWFVEVPMITIIDAQEMNEQSGEFESTDLLNWASNNNYHHQDKTQFISMVEDELFESYNGHER